MLNTATSLAPIHRRDQQLSRVPEAPRRTGDRSAVCVRTRCRM